MRVRAASLVAVLAMGVLPVAGVAVAGAATGRVGAASTASGSLVSVRVQGNHLVDQAGRVVVLRGVNRSSTEYACAQGWGVFHGLASDADQVHALEHALDLMQQWGINAVRVPLNESCWQGRGPDPAYVGASYQDAIRGWVSRITARGMAAIVDLHAAIAGEQVALHQQPMADAEHSPAFWRSVAGMFKDNRLVVFDLFNEPYLNVDKTVTDPWSCWRGGCIVHLTGNDDAHDQQLTAATFQAAGMQQLLDAVRSTGATNPVLLGGLQYAEHFDGLLSHLPTDPAGQEIVDWHAYNGNTCGLDAGRRCWETDNTSGPGPVAARLPLIAGEYGRDDCTNRGLPAFYDWMDTHASGYLAWAWMDTHASGYLAWAWITPDHPDCKTSRPDNYSLIGDYGNGRPINPTAQAVRRRYLDGAR